MRTQGRRTRARLLEAATSVLAERGYQGARVDDIVRTADTSHGTFYLYFANKEDLFRALAVECAGEMTDLAAELGPVDGGAAGLEELRSWLSRFLATYRRYGAVIRAWMEDQVPDRELTRLGLKAFADINGSLVARIEEARPGAADARLAAAALLAMIERFTYFVTSRGLELDDDAMLDTLARLVHRGFFAAARPAKAARKR